MKMIAFYFINILIAVYSAELFVEYNKNKYKSAALASIEKPDFRSKLDYLTDANENGIVEISPNFPPSVTARHVEGSYLFPLSNPSHAEIIFCNEIGKYENYESDRYGFRNMDQLYDSDGESISVIGDSFTQGACVSQEHSISGILHSQGIKNINFGVGGTGPLVQLGVLKEYALKTKGSDVFWLIFVGNDIRDLQVELGYPIVRSYVKEGFDQNLMGRQEEIDEFYSEFLESVKKNKIESHFIGDKYKNLKISFVDVLLLRNLRQKFGIRFLSRNRNRFDSAGHEEKQAEWQQELEKIFLLANASAESSNKRLHLVLLPDFDYFCANSNFFDRLIFCGNAFGGGSLYSRSVIESIKPIALASNFDSIIEPFLNTDLGFDEFFFYPGSHYNTAGYEMVAKSILGKLSEIDRMESR